MMDYERPTYICPECETKIVNLYEEGDCTYNQNLMALKLEEVLELHDHRNVGYTWHCTDKSCNAGSEGWFGDRTECPPTEKEFKEMSEADSSQSHSLFDERDMAFMMDMVLERLEEE